MIKASDGCCEEAALNAPAGMYLPCNKPAEWIVGWKGRTDKPIRMCFACKDHNVRNRGGEVIEKMTISEFSWHAAALKGERGPIHDGEPQSGFYRQRRQDKTYEPVAYWKDSKTGEQRCHINGRSVDIDRMMHTWPFAAKHPITEEAYFHRIETGAWADDDASAVTVAKAPADASLNPAQSIAAEIATAKSGLDAYKLIDSDELAARAQTLRSLLTTLKGRAEKAYEAANRPLLDEQVRIRSVWFPLRDEASDGADKLRKAMAAWEDEKRIAARKAQAEADNAARLHAEAIRKAAEADEPPPPPPPKPVAPNMPAPAVQIRGGSGRTASVTVEHIVIIDDETKAFEFLKGTPELTEVLQKLATRSFKAGRLPDGCRTEEKTNIR